MVALLNGLSLAQAPTATLRGQVTDPSGAVVRSAQVTAVAAGAQPYTAKTSQTGAYEIGNLPVGNYTVSVQAPGFAIYSESNVVVAAGQVQQFDIPLEIQVEQEKVEVAGERLAGPGQPVEQCERNRAQGRRPGCAA